MVNRCVPGRPGRRPGFPSLSGCARPGADSRHSRTGLSILLAWVLLGGLASLLAAEVMPGVPVGAHLYADWARLPICTGGLCLSLPDNDSPSLMAVAYGRKRRKDRRSRSEAIPESERERFKPILARLSADGKQAFFPPLPIDLYDLALIDPRSLTVHEGIALDRRESDAPDPSPESVAQARAGIERTLFPPKGKVGGWEGFFDAKRISRLELRDPHCGILLQQMRLGGSFAESGAPIRGCIHSLDIVWLERSRNDPAGWKVLERQQLYRQELSERSFFVHRFRKDLQGIRVGSTLRNRVVLLHR